MKSLNDYLKKVNYDLKYINCLKIFLQSKWEVKEKCIFTWQTIEFLNGILGNFSSQETPQTDSLEVLIDSLHFLGLKNKEKAVWNNFGFDLGSICVKILFLIEKTNVFDSLFEKLLKALCEMSEQNSDVWKASSRQIINIFINKKFSIDFYEKILKLYETILIKIEKVELNNFAIQNESLLKTFYSKIQHFGDFLIQQSGMKIISQHFSDKNLLQNFFLGDNVKNRELFRSLNPEDFENDCREYLNLFNKDLVEKKVFSLSCGIICIGGCMTEPPGKKKVFWIDANRDTERISIKCTDYFNPKFHMMLNIKFSQLIATKAEGLSFISIKIKNIKSVYKESRNDEIILKDIKSSQKDVQEFLNFLNQMIKLQIKKMKKFGTKLSQTCESTCINREEAKPDSQTPNKKVQVNAMSSSRKNIVLESQEISPNVFAESLSRNLGLNTPEINRSSEDRLSTVEFLSGGSKTSHKLFRSPLKTLHNLNENVTTVRFNNSHPSGSKEINVWSERKKTPECKNRLNEQLLETQEYFHSARKNQRKTKPLFPKLRNKRGGINESKSTEKSFEMKEKPSLLDPNGYAFQRWQKPSTSERSNFWLEKLKTLEEERTSTGYVFEFKETDTKECNVVNRKSVIKTYSRNKKNKTISIPEGMKKNMKENVVPRSLSISASKANPVVQKTITKITPLKKKMQEVLVPKKKEILAKKILPLKEIPQNKEFPKLVENLEKVDSCKDRNLTALPKENESPFKIGEKLADKIAELSFVEINLNSDSDVSDAEEKMEKRSNKRDLSEKENSITRNIVKKKLKIFQQEKNLPPLFQIVIKKVEEKGKRETKEILETIQKSAEHLFSICMKKQVQKIGCYFKNMQKIGPELIEDNDILTLAAHIHKLKTYYETKCSVNQLRELMDKKSKEILESLKEMQISAVNYTEVVTKMSRRLKELISAEVERITDLELEETKKKFMYLHL